MFLDKYLKQPVIKDRMHHYNVGDVLFRQGEKGDTMFIILEGIVQLFDESEGTPSLVGTYGPGQFFGEKTLLQSPIQRFFTAQARMRTIALQISAADLPVVQEVIPDFMVILFQAAAQRLDKAYSLIRILQTQDPLQKLIHCILYFYRSPGLESTAGRYISLNVSDVTHLIGMDEKTIQKCFDELSKRKILEPQKDGSYLLKSDRALLAAIPELEAALAA